MGYITQPYQLLICLQLLLLHSQCSAILCSHDQSSALLQFKQLFSFQKTSSSVCEGYQQSRPKMMSWKEDADCCSWDGVTCDSATGHVNGLDLSCSWLHGNIPSNSSLFFLPRLRKLNLAYNDFNYSEISSGFTAQFPSLTLLNLSWSNLAGSIPASLGNITQLVSLVLSYNNFSGHIPSSFSNLQQLHHLDLYDNKFVGKIPASQGNNLTLLSYLDLSCNSFSGHFPSSFSNLQQLRHLDLRANNFVGEIPDIFTNLTRLSYLDLAYNELIGSIPGSIFELVNLSEIFVSFNYLSGSIELYDFAKLKNLRVLFLSNISLSVSAKLTINSSFPNLLKLGLSACNISEFPDILKTQHQLEWLNLAKNQIRGRIPSWMWDIGVHTLNTLNLSHNFLTSIERLPWKNLELLDLNSNSLQGSLLELPPHMRFFQASHNNLTGEIPSSFCNLSFIEYLILYNNSLSGQIPQCLGNSKLVALNLGMNNFHGRIPETYAKGCKLKILLLSGNHLEGQLPTSLISCVGLEVIYARNNNFSGPIPECLGNSTLKILDMGMNKFSGSLPRTFAKSCVLKSLKLNSNQIEGPLPPSLINCQYLEVLDIGNNQITDTFPHWLEVLPELQVLILRSNRFRGLTSDSKTRVRFPKLRVIDLSHNEFTDVLPTWYLHSFKAMMNGDNNRVENEAEYMIMRSTSFTSYESLILTMKGIDLQMERVLIIFTMIDLSSNRFQGGIPDVVGKLSSLKGLNISHNNLTGGIPSSLGDLKELEFLDLSSNKLVGQIPMQLASLNFLSVLNLSYNQLEGHVPRGTQFNTFQNDSYAGNPGLCGFPLSESCDMDEAPEPSSPTSFNEGDDSSWFDWKFAKMGYASGLVIGLSIAYMVFATGRPWWFVKMIEEKQTTKVRRVSRRGRARR
ncbi:hypothetical protein WN944_009547 [Citrus x changshan-huyou]|uniref:Leucine-rich repeat-containing N-terminal plant-type domain-containing protein n=1 Tax=Citrus x changshan-huyou TaxID=2935761 RepID=A0AAP0MWD1_9ROSI